ncbi:hypothetical protein HK097_006022 [Rhizophlyctis rosea]|uniref:Uncharacterized protein n=1 Tax=Rhizophlyctis rosea TaxID=64517 RepID=A0AAD5SCX0_9FUNG|nr:hypothetical protein HK097_006022 [Rhizophlyctis rosea]
MDHGEGGHHMAMSSPECLGNDSAFLTTLAWCMKTACDNDGISVPKREEFWATKVTGDESVLPKWPYTQALLEIKTPPTVVYNASELMNQTVLLAPEVYAMQSNFMVMFDFIEALQSKYIFTILGFALLTPILMTYLPLLPYMSTLISALKPYLLYPATISSYHVRPLPYYLGNAPTIGQSTYIFLFFLINLILTCINYRSSQPHPWFLPPREELLAYIGYRTGHIGYALLPLVILFSGRNNFLLWITNWSYGTYLLLHRWIARAFAFHAIVHSVTLLMDYQGTGSYAENSAMAYWHWGISATVITCFMLVLSTLWFRRKSYELFLILHIILAALVIVGCWYHVILRFGFNFYTNWLYAAIGVWVFDRVLRILWIWKNGVTKSVVTEVGEDHVRIDVQGIRWENKPGVIAFAYFPTLKPLRAYENHPFSVTSTALLRPTTSSVDTITDIDSTPSSEASIVKQPLDTTTPTPRAVQVQDAHPHSTTGVTLIVKKSTGLTQFLKSNASLLTLLDGPYTQTHTSQILTSDRVLLIGGGIGIMGLVSWLHTSHPSIKLFWNVKSRHAALVQEVSPALNKLAEHEKVVSVGERIDLERALKEEGAKGYERIGVVACGPGEMCDEVRKVVSGLGRGGRTRWELEVDAYSW